jgi:vesicle-associated membrane protein 7
MSSNPTPNQTQESSPTISHRIPFAFLQEVETSFVTKYGNQAQTAIAFSMNDEFSVTLRSILHEYNTNQNKIIDNISKVQNQINDVKSTMVENISKVLERGEKIELLVDKTDKLNTQAYKFEKQSKKLKNVMYWKKIKMYSIIAMIFLLLIFAIVAFACGGIDFHRCS